MKFLKYLMEEIWEDPIFFLLRLMLYLCFTLIGIFLCFVAYAAWVYGVPLAMLCSIILWIIGILILGTVVIVIIRAIEYVY